MYDNSQENEVKKRFLYEERKEDLREEFRNKLNDIDEEKIVYVDESGFDTKKHKKIWLFT